MAHGSTIAALILMSCAVVTSYTVLNPEKPGECPAVFNPFLPAQKCDHDRDCPGDEKCCSYYHNSVCAPPRLPRCPMRPGVMGICIEECSGNWDCKHHYICCFNGCGHVCMPRKREKPGSCGERRFTHKCRGYSCHNDFQCHGDLKCCPTRCGRSCVKPMYWQID